MTADEFDPAKPGASEPETSESAAAESTVAESTAAESTAAESTVAEPTVAEPEEKSELVEVRSELRRLGYLDHQVERYLLQDVLKPERPLETLGHLAVKVGLLIGLPSALFGALVLAGANGLLRSSPFDLLPLFAHLLPWAILVPGLSFLALGGLLALFLRWTHVRRIEALSLGLAMLTAALAVITILIQMGWSSLVELPGWQWAALLGLLPLFAYLVFKVVHGGLLTLAIRLTDLTPEQPSSYGRWAVLALVVVTILLTVPAALDVENEDAASPAGLPSTGGRAVVIGVDGVLPQELEFLLEIGELPHLQRLASGGLSAAYSRSDDAPIAFWSTVATGLPSSVHGLDSLDTFRPLGVSRPLRRSGWLRYLWAATADLGWVEYRPVLAQSRKSWSFWELASRGGAKSLVVGWWGTFPVEPTPGLVVAHGGYQLLTEGSDLAAYPESELETLRAGAKEAHLPADLSTALAKSLPEGGTGSVVRAALQADDFYLGVFQDRLPEEPRAAALYLSSLDIIAAAVDLGSIAYGELIRRQLLQVDELLGRVAKDAQTTIILVVDPGRRGGAGREGRAFVLGPPGCAGQSGDTSAAALGSVALRALGLPQSRELPAPPTACDWPAPAAWVESYGPRRSVGRPGDEDSEEYLENLKSLGYL